MKQELERLLKEHREKAWVTCDETCFCWDVETFLDRHKEKDDGFAIKKFIVSEQLHSELLVPIFRENTFIAVGGNNTHKQFFDVLVYGYRGRVNEKEYQYGFQGLRSISI